MNEYILHVLYLLGFGALSYFNYIKVVDWRLRALIVFFLFHQYPDLMFAYCFGWDYMCCLMYSMYKKNIGINAFYPELDTPDRSGLVLISSIQKDKSVTWESLSWYYIVVTSIIILRIVYYVIVAGTAN